jgi:formamidopyrimidine-DNA glycosylase
MRVGNSAVTLAVFRALLSKGGKAQRRRRLAVFLMDQTKTSGVGNYILSEALYEAGVHPWATVGEVAADDGLAADLFHALRRVVGQSWASQRGRMLGRLLAEGGAGSVHRAGRTRWLEKGGPDPVAGNMERGAVPKGGIAGGGVAKRVTKTCGGVGWAASAEEYP